MDSLKKRNATRKPKQNPATQSPTPNPASDAVPNSASFTWEGASFTWEGAWERVEAFAGFSVGHDFSVGHLQQEH